VLESERPERRLELLAGDGAAHALIALSSPLGIEALPRAEAQPLIDAYLEGVGALPEQFGAWGPVALDALDPADAERVAARGCVGVSLPAGALAPASALAGLAPLLRRLEELDLPLFVHPGPGRRTRADESSLADPLWWPALTRYVSQMQAAWLAFATSGRRAHPRLRVLFAMLAGGAPLLAERLTARGGPPIELADPLSFYETSSYGRVATAAMGGVVGREQLLYGSDRPVAEPIESAREVLLAGGAERMLRARVLAP
jgi:hypothetical protein